MPRPAATPATAREIILEVVRNMRDGLEPLAFTVLPPAVYRVYLHPEDLERLRGILPRIADEARGALDDEVAKLNRAPFGSRLRLSRESPPKVEPPGGGWVVEFLENTEDDTQPGDIVIYSELALPARPDFGSGSMTKRIATSRIAGESKSSQQYQEPAPAPAPADSAETYAIIRYEDRGGPKQYRMTKNSIVVGRGGRDYWTDVRLDALPDVSREHLRIRRDPATGEFFVKDLSQFGTTIDGKPVPSSIETTGEGEKKDKNVEVPLPARARIGLAGVAFLDFEASGGK